MSNKNHLKLLYETPEQISTMFKERCNYSHNICQEVQTNIMKLYSKGGKVDNDFLSRYLLFLANGSWSPCIQRKITWTKAVCTILSSNFNPSYDNLKIIIKYGGSELNILQAFDNMLKNGVNFDVKILNMCLQESQKHERLFDKLLEKVKPDQTSLELACALGKDDLVKKILMYKIPVTVECINNCTLGNCNEDTLSKLINMGGKPDTSTLEIACRIRNHKFMKNLLQSRILPNKKCFEAIFNKKYNVGFRYSYRYGSHISETEKKEIAATVDILIEHGYKIDYNDVVFALSKECFINDINRFNIDFGPKFLEKCTEYNYYPYDIDTKPTLKCLRIECGRTGNLSTVKKLISKGVKPDIECLRIACNNKSNKQTIHYLVDKYGLKPDLTCLKNNAKHINNVTLNYILENYDEPKVNVKKNKKEDLSSSEDSIIESSEEEKKVSTDNNDLDDKQENYDNLAKELELDLDEDSKNINKKSKKNIKVVKDKDKKKSKINSNKEIKLEEPKNIPKSKRTKEKIPTNIIKFFKIKTGTKLSFIKLRKYMMDYIKNNELYDKEDKTMIIPDKKLCKLLKLDDDVKVNFAYFDNLVYQCYNN